MNTGEFKVGESIKFKWLDLRRKRKGRIMEFIERRTWTYGYVTEILTSTNYHWYRVRVVKGGLVREGVNVDPKEARIWSPRKK